MAECSWFELWSRKGQLQIFGILFPMRDCLALPCHKERSSVLPQLDASFFAQTLGRLIPFWMEIEEEWIGKEVNRKGESTGEEEGAETDWNIK